MPLEVGKHLFVGQIAQPLLRQAQRSHRRLRCQPRCGIAAQVQFVEAVYEQRRTDEVVDTPERADDSGHAGLQKTTRQTDALIRQASEVGNRGLAGREHHQAQIAQRRGIACHQVAQREATLLREEQGAIEGIVKPNWP